MCKKSVTVCFCTWRSVADLLTSLLLGSLSLYDDAHKGVYLYGMLLPYYLYLSCGINFIFFGIFALFAFLCGDDDMAWQHFMMVMRGILSWFFDGITCLLVDYESLWFYMLFFLFFIFSLVDFICGKIWIFFLFGRLKTGFLLCGNKWRRRRKVKLCVLVTMEIKRDFYVMWSYSIFFGFLFVGWLCLERNTEFVWVRLVKMLMVFMHNLAWRFLMMFRWKRLQVR